MTNKNTICLWYDGAALEAAQFYANTFPDSQVQAVHCSLFYYPAGHQGDVLTVKNTRARGFARGATRRYTRRI